MNLSLTLVAADVRLKHHFLDFRWILLTSAATLQESQARIVRGTLSRLLSGLAAAALTAVSARAEYHNFNTGANCDGVVQEVRWPYWAESTYNAIYSQTLSGADGASGYFYGGMPYDTSGDVSIIWSFWPPGGTAVAGAAVTADWTATNMYAPPHVGEGASGKVSGSWPLVVSNQWYREVMRIWQPPDGTAHLAYLARWLRDPRTTNWYHIATMKVPFSATGINGLSGFQEDFGNGNRNPRRTDYRNAYYHNYSGGTWQSANEFTPSVRQLGENGTCGLIENATAAFFETCSGSNYLYAVTNHVPATTGNLVMLVATNWSSASFATHPPPGVTAVAAAGNYAQYTCVLTNQPATPPIDPILVSSSSAAAAGNQLITQWQLPPNSSPQFAYQIDVFNNAGYSGSPSVSFYDIDPEARQKLLDITGVATPFVRLTIIDVYNVTNPAILITPSPVTLSAATNVAGATNGLAYQYYESGSSFGRLPDFATLTPVYQGAVDDPDLTPRRQRSQYAFNFTGFVNVPAGGLYTFTLTSSDGSRLVIDGATVVNWDGEHSPGPMSGWAALAAGLHAVNLQYFFDNQNSNAGDLIDQLAVAWSGPGIPAGATVPAGAWFRVAESGEPSVALTAPTNGPALGGSNVLFNAAVAPNGNTINRVQFYLGNNFWGQDATAPFNLNSFVWAAPNNAFHARLFYNSNHTLDSAPNLVTTTNMTLAPWLLASVSDHVYPNGGRIANGTYTLLGDGLNLLGRQVTGDCTLIGHVSGIISSAAGPDGQTPGSDWSAGIMLRGSTNSTPGTPLGNGANRYACVFGTVGNGTYFEDDTMSGGGGPYASGNLGSYVWYKIQRVGDTFTTGVSSDGANWLPVNTNTLSGIGATIYAGVFTYAASSQNPNVHWASFDHVNLTGQVVGPPTVSVSPAMKSAGVGQTAIFTALPGGAPPFYYQWQLNGRNLADATNATLTLTNLQATNSGLYTVVLADANGSVSATAPLTVLTLPPAAAQIMANQPLAYFRLNETAGPTAYDSAGNDNATGEGNLVFGVAGVTNAPFTGFESGNLAAQFDGSSSDIAVPPFDVTTTNFTITGWVKFNGAQNSWSGLVFSRGSGYGTGLMVANNGNNLELRYSWNDNGGDYNWSTGLNPPTNNAWAFMALTIEPARAIVYLAASNTLKSATNNVTNSGRSQNGTFYLGYDPNSSSRRLNGALDEIAFYNRTLTPAQIGQILAASEASPPGVTLSAPASGANFGAPANLSLTAAVTANGHAINRVQFFNGAEPLGSVSDAPYTFTWTNVAAGAYTLLAQVTYDATNTLSSAPAFVTVNALPATPQYFSATAVAANEASLTWSAASNATGYVITRNGAAAATVTGTGWLDTALTPSTTYAYSVTATSPWGVSPPSPTNSITTPATGNGLAWEADGETPAAQDASGNWGRGATNWWNGQAIVPWTDGSIAAFGAGVAGGNTVTLTNDATPAGIVFAGLGGGYTLAGSGGGIILAGAATFNCPVDGAVSAVVKGTGSLVKTGAGTLTLSGMNTYSGGTTISNGVLQIVTGGVLPGNITDDSALLMNRGDAVNWPGLISGSGSVTLQGGGALYFTNASANTYAGGTLIASGTLGLGNNGNENVNSLGSGSVTVNSGGTLGFYPGSTGAGFNVPNAVVLNGGTIRSEDGVQKINGPITVEGGGGAIQTEYGGKTLWFNGALSGAGNLTLDNADNPYGMSTLYLAADNSGYTGTFTVNAASSGWNGGQLSINHVNALRNANLVMNTPRDILFSGVAAPVFGSLAGAGSLTLPNGVNLSVGNNNASTTYSGALLGAGALTKVGSGTFTLSGACTNSGPVAVGNGTLLVNGSTGPGAVSVASNAVLGGTGVIHGATTVSSGGTLAPGTNGMGTLTINNNLTLAAGSWTLMQIGDNGGVLTSDLVIVSGLLTPGGTLVVANTGSNAPAPGDSFKLFNAGAWGGAFANFSLPALGAGLGWDTSTLATNGAISVIRSLPPAVTRVTMAANRAAFTVTGTGTAGQNYILLAATNLAPTEWQPVQTNAADANGQFQFADLQAGNYARRFYRVQGQ